MDIAIPVNEYVWSFIQFYKKAVEKGADFMGEDLAEEADLVWEILVFSSTHMKRRRLIKI